MVETKKYSVLYIDDDEIMLYIFERSFKEHYNIILADSPEKGLKVLENQDVDVVISDNAMPNMTGIELLKLVSEKYPDKGRILTTGDNSPETIKEAINDAGVHQFVSKPWEKENLRFALNKTIEIYQLKLTNLILGEKLKEVVSQQEQALKNQDKLLKINLNVVKNLNNSSDIQEGNWHEAVKRITEILSKSMEISRVAIWYHESEKNDIMTCLNLYQKQENTHKSNYEFKINQYPEIEQVIKQGWIVHSEDVLNRKSNNLPPKEYLEKNDIRSLIYLPINLGRGRYAALMCEQTEEIVHWSNYEIQFIISVTDIITLAYRTYERKQTEDELKETNMELKATHSQLLLSEKMASIGQLTAGVAHEINNPINFVYAGINALDTNYKEFKSIITKYEQVIPDESTKKVYEEIQELKNMLDYEELKLDIETLIEDIREGAMRTTEIVKGLRNFSRLDEAESKLADIHEGIDSTLTLLNNSIRGRVEIVKKYDNAIPPIYCFPGQLNQVFMNILTNATQAIEGKGNIIITTSLLPNEVSISIKDDGVGIQDEVKSKIFDPFFTTKDVGKGTGLGLSITYSIIQKHKGSVEVISEPNKGTEILIKIPIME
ncbi:MAG: response regulator [Cyclobacteriaceae bacterium]|nr:response regulator [Cyclobacteriaceae bacterium]